MYKFKEITRFLAIVASLLGALLTYPSFAQSSFTTDEIELLEIDQLIADAVVRGDTVFVDSVTPDDFVMVHGDDWTQGRVPFLVDNKQSMLGRVTDKYYDVLDFDSVQVEMHGDVAITYGRYIAHTRNNNNPDRAWFSVWFERVFAKRDGIWIYLSHRTVNGPFFGSSREAVFDK